MSDQTESTPVGKGRPTPKRKDAQARRPVSAPPASRKEAARQLRDKQAEQRRAVRQANLTGDDKLLLPRDRGPERRLVRDLVDGRRSLGFLLLPGALVVVVAGFTGDAQLQAMTFGIWLAILIGVTFDLTWAGIQIYRALKTRFPGSKKRGSIAYGLLRTTVIRRYRMPRPQVDRGHRV